jgi:hypothetical protein
LQISYSRLCPFIVLPLRLQPDSGSSCNRCTLRVANTECSLLMLYYPFSCNPTEVRVAIDTLRVANKCFRLILYYLFDCNWTVIVPIYTVVIGLDLLLQPVHVTSCNCIIYIFYRSSIHAFICVATVPIYIVVICLHLLLQLVHGISCNHNVCKLAINYSWHSINTECFRLILYYLFSCNRTVV